MRELVYLSHSKLGQFLPPLRSSWPQARVRLVVPVAEIEVEPRSGNEDAESRRLEDVATHIRRQATWYVTPPSKPGQWAAFEAPMNYLTPWDDVVLFLDEPARHPEGSAPEAVRLLLHGSASNLVAGRRPLSTEPPDLHDGETVESRRRTAGSRRRTVGNRRNRVTSDSRGYVEIASRVHAMEALVSGIRAATVTDPIPSPEPWGTFDTQGLNGVRHADLAGATRRLIGTLEQQVHPDLAIWVAGYARVTTSLLVTGDPLTRTARGYVVASPLYIETIPDPAAPVRPRRRVFRRGR